MAFHSNTTQNTVVYSSPTWETSVVENDITLGSAISTTAGLIPAFKIALGKYERIIGEAVLYYDSSNANELDFRFMVKDSADAYVDAKLTYGVAAIIGDVANQASTTHDDIKGGMNTDAASLHNDTGQGSIIKIDAASDDTPLLSIIKFAIIGKEGKNGTAHLQVAGDAGTPTLFAGSYITYKRF